MSVVYGSQVLPGSYGSAYLSSKHLKCAIKNGSYYDHHMGGYGAPVVHSSDAAAPVIYDSHSGIYGSAYLSRKHLKRAIKYGSYYGALAAVAYSPLTQGAYGAPFPQGSMVTVTT